MNKYEKLAEKIKERLIENKGTIEVTAQEALDIYLALLALIRIKNITESEYGGVEQL